MADDVITLIGVRAEGTHGVLPAERATPQTFVVDARMSVDLSDACRSDDLADTVSYAQIAERIVSVVKGEHCDLIERLAQRIADAILLSYRVTAVEVTVHKPDAPIAVPFGDVSVTITRHQKVDGEGDGTGLEGTASDEGAPSAASKAIAAAASGTEHRDESDPVIRHAVIAMGGNLGDAAQAMRSAIASIDALPGTQIIGISPLYRSAPWGMAPGTPDFLNAVIEADTTLTPRELLDALQRIETAHGRRRETHWGSRTLDLDIIDIDGEESDDPSLTLPHPRAWQRAFVLLPWLDLDFDAHLSGAHSGFVRILAEGAPDRDLVRKVSDTWILGGLDGGFAGPDGGDAS